MVTMDTLTSFLLHKMESIKLDLASVGISPKQFARWEGDKEYAEEELRQALMCETGWDGWENYQEIVAHPLWVKAVRWQAAYNASGI